MCKSLFLELQHEGRCAWRFSMTNFAGNHLCAGDADHRGEGDKGNGLNDSGWRVNQTQELTQHAIVEMLYG